MSSCLPGGQEGPQGDDAFALDTYKVDPDGASFLALFEGDLVTLGEGALGCVGFSADGRTSWLLLPDGYRLRRADRALFHNGTVVALNGDPVNGSGGYPPPGRVLKGCPMKSGDSYFVANDIRKR
jgi:hypothetical protein